MSRTFLTDGFQSAGTTRTQGTSAPSNAQQESPKKIVTAKDGDDSTSASSAQTRRISHATQPKEESHEPENVATSILKVMASRSGGGGGFKERRSLKKIATGMATLFSIRNLTKKPEPKPVKLENTYKMAPDKEVNFNSCTVENAIKDILKGEIAGMRYDEEQCKELVLGLTDLIKDKVKTLGFSRHKIVCNVYLGQTNDQGIEMSSRGLWDPRFDSWACASYKNDSIFAVAMVHAFFVE